MNTMALQQFRRIRLTLFLCILVLTAGVGLRSDACMSSPPPPFCAKSLVLAKAGPPAVFVPAGVAPAFAVPYTVYWQMINVGAPNLCPPPSGPGGTFPATLTLNVACIGGPGLPAPVVIPVNLARGYNPGAAPVVLPAGPPRVCTIVGQVDLTLLDGMMLRANGDNVVCIVEPAPGDPSIPRLDLQTLTPQTQNMHPGDQGRFDYRLTNKDPIDNVTVDIDAEMENVSRLPTMLGPPGAPGTGIFSASDPVEGDNFPIGFDEDLAPAGCLFLPGDPGNPQLATTSQTVTLAPGESHDFSLHTRAFGLCADGSCGEGRLVVDGTFDNGDTAVSCTGLVHAVDNSAPPLYQWPGSGRVVQMQPLDPFALALFGEPQPGLPLQMDNVSFPSKAGIGPSPALVEPQLLPFDNTDNQRVRYIYELTLPDNPIQPGEQGFFAWQTQYFSPIPVDILQVAGIKLHAPSGFETLGPGAIVSVAYNSFGPPLVNFFDIMYQLSGEAVDNDTGQRVPIEIVALDLQDVSPVEVAGFAQFQIPPQLGIDYESVVLNVDVRGFSHGVSDSDLDGLPDSDDNCAVTQNGPSVPDVGGNVQRDTDGDNIGNACDADIAPALNDCVVNALDLGILKMAFFSNPASTHWNPDADFNGDDQVNVLDLGFMKSQFFGTPGPSGLPNACD